MPPRRSARAAPASTAPEPVQTRRTRGRPRPSQAAEADNQDTGIATRTRAARPASSAPVKGSLTDDPRPRKGPPSDARGELNISSDRPHNEDDDDEGEEEEEEEEEEEHGDKDDDEEQQGEETEAGASGDEEEEKEPVVDLETGQLEFMRQNIVKLTDTAESILERYRVFGKADGVDRRTFEMELDALAPVRKHFIVQETYDPFLHWDWLRGRRELSKLEVHGFKSALIVTNLATLMQIVYQRPKEADAKQLEVLNKHFQDLVLGGDHLDLTEPLVDLALEIRVAHALAKLSTLSTKVEKKNSKARETVYHIFCGDPTGKDANEITSGLEDGPYRPIAGYASDNLHRWCRNQVAVFLKHISNNNATFSNIKLLRDKFPAEHLLLSVKGIYQHLAEHIHDPQGTEEPAAEEPIEEFHDAAAELSDSDSSDDGGESQPIVRVSETQAGPSHFHDATDAQAFEVAARSRIRVSAVPPPSNQQASGSHRGTLPVNLDAAPLSSPSSRQRRRKRTSDEVDTNYHPATGGDEDEDEDAFQTDTRRLDETARRQKRQRLTAEHAARVEQRLLQQQTQQQIQSSPSRSYPPLSTSTTAVATQRPDPLPVDFRAIEANKRAALEEHSISPRREQHRKSTSVITTVAGPARPSIAAVSSSGSRAVIPGVRQRHAWTEHDSRVLLECIERRFGKWSLIEKEDNKYFDHPRDQQAYRDRARNMKVDFLITDARLPPGFDFVMLGPKEKVRVMGFGKNPARQERDVDFTTGQVTNTQLVPEAQPM